MTGKKRTATVKPVPDLIRRQRAIEATKRRFGGKPFKLGKADCVHLLRFHLVQMGHRRLPKPGKYSSPGGAMAMIEALGARDLESLLDQYLKRIAPAAMLPGDVALVATEPHAPAWRAGSAVISLGRKFLGWHPDHQWLAINEPIVSSPYLGAWRA